MKNFFLATRPKTLVAAIIPPLMSYALANIQHFDVDLSLVVCCVLGALFIQLATNFFNDLIDLAPVFLGSALRLNCADF